VRCEDVQERLDAHVRGELTAEVAEAVGSHLATCPTCASEHEQIVNLARQVTRLMEATPPPPSTQHLMERVRAAQRDQMAGSSSRPGLFRWLSRLARGNPRGGERLQIQSCTNCEFALGTNPEKCEYCRIFTIGSAESQSYARSRFSSLKTVATLALLIGLVGGVAGTRWCDEDLTTETIVTRTFDGVFGRTWPTPLPRQRGPWATLKNNPYARHWEPAAGTPDDWELEDGILTAQKEAILYFRRPVWGPVEISAQLRVAPGDAATVNLCAYAPRARRDGWGRPEMSVTFDIEGHGWVSGTSVRGERDPSYGGLAGSLRWLQLHAGRWEQLRWRAYGSLSSYWINDTLVGHRVGIHEIQPQGAVDPLDRVCVEIFGKAQIRNLTVSTVMPLRADYGHVGGLWQWHTPDGKRHGQWRVRYDPEGHSWGDHTRRTVHVSENGAPSGHLRDVQDWDLTNFTFTTMEQHPPRALLPYQEWNGSFILTAAGKLAAEGTVVTGDLPHRQSVRFVAEQIRPEVK
jgi:hypothetical protein